MPHRAARPQSSEGAESSQGLPGGALWCGAVPTVAAKGRGGERESRGEGARRGAGRYAMQSQGECSSSFAKKVSCGRLRAFTSVMLPPASDSGSCTAAVAGSGLPPHRARP